MAFNATLPLAIRKTVADILKISEKNISMPVISSTRRVLLSGMYVSYDLNLISTRTPESFKAALMESVTTGGFVQVLHANSGVLLVSTYGLHFVDTSPTFAPAGLDSVDTGLPVGAKVGDVSTKRRSYVLSSKTPLFACKT